MNAIKYNHITDSHKMTLLDTTLTLSIAYSVKQFFLTKTFKANV